MRMPASSPPVRRRPNGGLKRCATGSSRHRLHPSSGCSTGSLGRNPRPSPTSAGKLSVIETHTMVSALNEALRGALRDDPRVLVFAEDVGRMGGAFRVTEGLQ